MNIIRTLMLVITVVVVGTIPSYAEDGSANLPVWVADKSDEQIAKLHYSNQLLIAIQLAKGKQIPRDLDHADRFFETASHSVPKDAADIAGLTFYHIDRAGRYAAKWLARAGALGNDFAYVLVGEIYEQGRDVDQDYARARQYYELADHPSAYSALSRLFAKGLGGDKDLGRAMLYHYRSQEKRPKND